ncbi:MAG: galactokinase [Terrimicrobiaceae bacterium]|nr:galactokinase [Terrimicrobiaceae bacterium]
MEIESFAPGRVELLGNHTDYNEGVVLSAALDLGITLRARRRERGFVLRSTGHPDVETPEAVKTGTWADYALGVVAMFERAGMRCPGFEAEVVSTLSAGAGLSSSAALEVATAFLICRLGGHEIAPMELARLCRKAENEFVGVACGLLDQASSVFGEAGRAVFLDCRAETVRTAAFPAGCALLIVNSGVRHALTGGEYNERRAACFEAARALGVRALRDATEADVEAGRMPETARARARHITGENRRVFAALGALEAGDAAAFGRLMFESHESSRRNFENSTPELDLLVELAGQEPGVFGARLTGGGFGGAIVALGCEDRLAAAGENLREKYRAATGLEASALVCHPGDGALARRRKPAAAGSASAF